MLEILMHESGLMLNFSSHMNGVSIWIYSGGDQKLAKATGLSCVADACSRWFLIRNLAHSHLLNRFRECLKMIKSHSGRMCPDLPPAAVRVEEVTEERLSPAPKRVTIAENPVEGITVNKTGMKEDDAPLFEDVKEEPGDPLEGIDIPAFHFDPDLVKTERFV